jgi:hypothetical protein
MASRISGGVSALKSGPNPLCTSVAMTFNSSRNRQRAMPATGWTQAGLRRLLGKVLQNNRVFRQHFSAIKSQRRYGAKPIDQVEVTTYCGPGIV